MSTAIDPLTGGRTTDRVYYATGVLLGPEDFTDEQSYHRGRLALALAYLHGSGTVAGLRVEHQPAAEPAPDLPEGREEMLLVSPGMAIDRIGRIVEIPREACLRLGRWYEGQAPDDLIEGLHGAPFDGVMVDVFVRFVPCERGKTPAFASGPFDALDAVVPSRLRDGYELELVIRKEATADLPDLVPQNRWPGGDGSDEERQRAIQEAILGSWPKDGSNNESPEPLLEYVPGQDRTAIFLARLVIPATPADDAGARPVRQAGEVQVDNHRRLFVYNTRALGSRSSL